MWCSAFIKELSSLVRSSASTLNFCGSVPWQDTLDAQPSTGSFHEKLITEIY